MSSESEKSSERKPGPIWGGWWFWEPPRNAEKEDESSNQEGEKK